jgi:phosphate:Na+ symporter
MSVAAIQTAASGSTGLGWPLLAMGLLGGGALLLYGLDRMSAALKRVAGGRLRQTLTAVTRTPLSGFATGIGVAALTQSSTVVTVTVVGLSAAGLLTLEQSIPIILGANIGTTITAQLIAFNVSGSALWLVGAGYGMSQLRRWPRAMLWGEALFGLGLVFLGLHTLIAAMEPLRQSQPVQAALAHAEQPWIALLAGLLLAALIHSSAAVIGIVLALCTQGLIPLPAAIAVCLGAEVGTCWTALLASFGRSVPARRVAVAHLVFNAVGALATLPFVGALAGLMALIGGGEARQLANALTVFNIVWALAFLGVTRQLAGLVARLIPERTEEQGPLAPARFLSPEYLAEPELAFAMVRRELGRMGERIEPAFAALPRTLEQAGGGDLTGLQQLGEEVSQLYDQLTAYLGRVSMRELPAEHAGEFLGLMRAANGMHQITHLITNLAADITEEGQPLVPAVAQYSAPFHATVAEALRLALRAITEVDQAAAAQVSASKRTVNDQLRDLRLRAATELAQHPAAQAGGRGNGRSATGGEPDSFELSYAQLMNLLEQYKRIYFYARRSGRTVLADDNGSD